MENIFILSFCFAICAAQIIPGKPSQGPEPESRLITYASCNGPALDGGSATFMNPILVQSPNFPYNYPTNITCYYYVYIPKGRNVYIHVSAYRMDCPWDYLQIMTDFGTSNGVVLCPESDVLSDYSITPASRDYYLIFVFYSGLYVTYPGFQVYVYLDQPIPTLPPPPPTTTTLSPPSSSDTTTRNPSTAVPSTSGPTTVVSSTPGSTTTAPTSTPVTSTPAPTTKTPVTTTTPVPTTTTTTIPATTTTTTPVPTTTTTTIPATTTAAPSSCKCSNWSIRSLDRIINGTNVPLHGLPYQVGIYQTNGPTSPYCGGTLISPDYILTAAHCTAGKTPGQVYVALNDTNFQAADGEFYVTISSILIHPNYNNKTQDNDFSILKLSKSAPLSNTVGVACLPPGMDTFAGSNLLISGWGYITANGPQPGNLRSASVYGMSNTDCAAVDPKFGALITSNMICATVPDQTVDACQGDSGGPLVGMVNGKVTLIGVTSFGVGCAKKPYPGVYARVSAQKDWILSSTNALACQN